MAQVLHLLPSWERGREKERGGGEGTLAHSATNHVSSFSLVIERREKVKRKMEGGEEREGEKKRGEEGPLSFLITFPISSLPSRGGGKGEGGEEKKGGGDRRGVSPRGPAVPLDTLYYVCPCFGEKEGRGKEGKGREKKKTKLDIPGGGLNIAPRPSGRKGGGEGKRKGKRAEVPVRFFTLSVSQKGKEEKGEKGKKKGGRGKGKRVMGASALARTLLSPLHLGKRGKRREREKGEGGEKLAGKADPSHSSSSYVFPSVKGRKRRKKDIGGQRGVL